MRKTKKRAQRLQSARIWIIKYEGKNIVKGYTKHFAVDIMCAIAELQLLGHKFTDEYINSVRKNIESKKIKQREKKEKDLEGLLYSDSDDTFYFIAGYTSGGAPYGITWEEAKSIIGEEGNGIDYKNNGSDF